MHKPVVLEVQVLEAQVPELGLEREPAVQPVPVGWARGGSRRRSWSWSGRYRHKRHKRHDRLGAWRIRQWKFGWRATEGCDPPRH
jgi:hypothetical protein